MASTASDQLLLSSRKSLSEAWRSLSSPLRNFTRPTSPGLSHSAVSFLRPFGGGGADQVNGHYGPTLLDEAEALAVAMVATVERLSFGQLQKPQAPSIKG